MNSNEVHPWIKSQWRHIVLKGKVSKKRGGKRGKIIIVIKHLDTSGSAIQLDMEAYPLHVLENCLPLAL